MKISWKRLDYLKKMRAGVVVSGFVYADQIKWAHEIGFVKNDKLTDEGMAALEAQIHKYAHVGYVRGVDGRRYVTRKVRTFRHAK